MTRNTTQHDSTRAGAALNARDPAVLRTRAHARAKFPTQSEREIAPDIIREAFAYSPETGIVTRAGKPISGRTYDGYLFVIFMGRKFRAHRIGWFLHYGAWPAGQVDHITGDRTDNRLCNLRLASNAQNQANAKLSPRNKSGAKGVSWCYNGWRATVSVNGKRVQLGCFATVEEAAAVYAQAAAKIYGEFARPIVSSAHGAVA